LDDRAWGTSPLWNCRNVVAEGCVIDLVNENTEESSRLIARVGLELRLDMYDEDGSYDGEKTGLYAAESAHGHVSEVKNTHED